MAKVLYFLCVYLLFNNFVVSPRIFFLSCFPSTRKFESLELVSGYKNKFIFIFLYFGDHLGRLIYSYSEIKYNLMVLLLENFNVGGRQSFKRWLGWNSWSLTEFWIFFCSSLIFSKFCTSPPPWPSRSLMRASFRNLNLITIYQNFHWTVKQLLPKPN